MDQTISPQTYSYLDIYVSEFQWCLYDLKYLQRWKHMTPWKTMNVSQKNVVGIVKLLIEALLHCPDKGIIHRDIKTNNILLPSPLEFGDINLEELGWSTYFSKDEILLGYLWMPPYMHPNIMEVVGYYKEVNIWSPRIFPYIIFYDIFPYKGKNINQILWSVKTSNPCLKTSAWRKLSKCLGSMPWLAPPINDKKERNCFGTLKTSVTQFWFFLNEKEKQYKGKAYGLMHSTYLKSMDIKLVFGFQFFSLLAMAKKGLLKTITSPMPHQM